jgi:DNA-binding LacI/PurR family transcriptional regulator
MTNCTLKDIAKNLDISISTVSRALSNHPDISVQTKKLVKQKATELNYNPNIMAQGLKAKRTKTIGVIVPEIEHHFFSAAISGIEEVAYQAGYTIIVSSSNEDIEREIINLHAFYSNRVAGVIASISQTTIDGSHFQRIMDNNVPVVFFDRVLEDIDSCKVVINDQESAHNAVMYLIKKGYKKIAHLAGTSNINIAKHRMAGYKNAMLESGLKIENDWIIEGGLHELDGYKSFEILLKLSTLPEAIFAVNDPVAIGALKKIREAGLSVPEDIAIVGFSDNPICEMIIPSLTTVHQPAYEMGKKSAELILESINNEDKDCKKETITLDAELIIRDST